MAAPQEFFNFATKFFNLWHSGMNAQFLAECEDGNAYVNLRLHLGQAAAAPPDNQHLPQGRPSPSRQRRRARSANDRVIAAAAAANAATRAEDYALPPVPDSPTKYTAANAPKTVEAAVQAAAYHQPTYKEVAVQAEAEPLSHVGEDLDTPLHEAETAAEPSLHRLRVDDVFCPDDYFKASKDKQERERRRDRETRVKERKDELEKLEKLLQKSFKF